MEHLTGAGSGQNLNAHISKAPGNAHDLLLILVLDGDDDTPPLLGYPHVGALEGLQEGLGEGLSNAQHLAGGLHLRAKASVHIGELLEGEHGHLHGVVVGLLVDAGAVA